MKDNQTATASAQVLDGNDQPLQGRTVNWTVSGGPASIAPSSSTTSTGANSTATATLTSTNVIFTAKSDIKATEAASGRSDTKTLTVQP